MYEELKKAVRDAQCIREDSYVRADNPKQDGHYTKSYSDAAREASNGNPDTTFLVNVLITHAWNDVHDWANDVEKLWNSMHPWADSWDGLEG